MDPEHWHRVTAVFEAALLREPAARAAFIAGTCAGDEALLHDVEALLRGHEWAPAEDTWSTGAPERQGGAARRSGATEQRRSGWSG